jgi:hypothetical protein
VIVFKTWVLFGKIEGKRFLQAKVVEEEADSKTVAGV